MTPPDHTRAQAKARARAIRAECRARGEPISQSAALERVAAELGFRDWNTASTRLPDAPDTPLRPGDRIEGTYLKQAFTGQVLDIRETAGGSTFQITVGFDVPVDVVTFDSFSNFRQRVSAEISKAGVSSLKTSDGVPHLVVRRAPQPPA